MATEADKVNDGALATLVAVGTFAMIGICAFVTALVRHEVSSETERKEAGADRQLRDVAAAQKAKLAAPPAWVDKGKGLVSLPIDRAKELVLGDLARDPNSATPPPPVPPDAGAATDANLGDAGAEAADAGVAPEAGAAEQSAVEGGAPKENQGGASQPAEKKAEATPEAPAPAPQSAPAPGPTPPASVATPTPQQ